MAKTIAQLAAQLILDNSKFDKGIDSSKDKVEKFAKDGEKGFSRITKRGADLIAKAGAIELGFKGVQAAAELLNGDFDNFVATMEQLPAGIGPAVAAFNDMAFALLGVNEMIEETARATGLLDEHNNLVRMANTLQEKLTNSTIKYNNELKRMSINSPFDLARFDTINQAEKDIKKMTDAFNKLDKLGKLRSKDLLLEAKQKRGELMGERLKIIENDRVNSNANKMKRVSDDLANFFDVKAVDPVFDKILDTIAAVKKLDESRSMLPDGFKIGEKKQGDFMEVVLSRLPNGGGLPQDRVLTENKKQTDLLKRLEKNTRIGIEARYTI